MHSNSQRCRPVIGGALCSTGVLFPVPKTFSCNQFRQQVLRWHLHVEMQHTTAYKHCTVLLSSFALVSRPRAMAKWAALHILFFEYRDSTATWRQAATLTL